jgi:hypothetical protein
MSGAEHLAANVIAPIDGNIIVLSGSTTDKIATLSATALFGNNPANWYRHYITIQPEGGNLWFYLSPVSKTAAGSITKTVAATKALGTVPWFLADGQRLDFRIKRHKASGQSSGSWTTKILFLCSVAATKVRLYISSATTSEEELTG